MVGRGVGTGIWAASYPELVPLGIYESPWEYWPRDLAFDPAYHLVDGLGVSAAFAALER